MYATEPVTYDLTNDFLSSDPALCPIVNFTLTKQDSSDPMDTMYDQYIQINATHLIIQNNFTGEALFDVKAQNTRG